jgi:cytidyltransferase-like protein
MILYADMVGDLFHYGHVEFLMQIYLHKKKEDRVYIGVHSDMVVESYKRTPIMTMDERIKVIEACKYVDKVIPNAPLFITEEFLTDNNIDLIFIPNNRTEEEISTWLKVPLEKNMICKVCYTTTISTTDIIKRIKSNTN